MAEMTPSPKPRPTIRLRPVGVKIKPVGAPAAPAAETPAAPVAAAPVAAEPVAEAPVPPTDAVAAVANEAKSKTACIPLAPETVAQATADAAAAPAAPAEGETPELKPLSSATQNIPTEALQEATPEQRQAAKSKTARIALDSVLGGIAAAAPMGGSTQKTIKLKRMQPTTVTTTSKTATPIPTASSDSKPTIKLRGTTPKVTLKKDAAGAAPEMEELETLDESEMSPISGQTAAPVAEPNKAFSIIAIITGVAAVLVVAVLICCMGSQAGTPGGAPTANTLGSLPFDPLPWIK